MSDFAPAELVTEVSTENKIESVGLLLLQSSGSSREDRHGVRIDSDLNTYKVISLCSPKINLISTLSAHPIRSSRNSISAFLTKVKQKP